MRRIKNSFATFTMLFFGFTAVFCNTVGAENTECVTPPCLIPSLTQSQALLDKIEARYSEYFAPSSPIQTLQINTAMAHYRLYNRSSYTGLATYQGSLWYAVNGQWVQYSSLDDANRLFCNSECWNSASSNTSTPQTQQRFKGEVWVDNWFSLYVGDTKVAEDSVPITTERSFNSETFNFTASYPFDLNFVIKDYKQDDTGLEYIGTPKQQIGDGGFIMQITDISTHKVIAVSNNSLKCLVIQKAPLNTNCEKDITPSRTCLSKSITEPATWKSTGYDVSRWENASIYSAEQVGVKEGFFTINWDASAKLVWTSDLKLDNTLLCKLTVSSP